MRGGNGFAPYLPRLIHQWAGEGTAAAARTIEGSLVSADVSGFTSLSERLARKGKLGAEELILLISGCFEGLIGIAERHGGDVLKFRGDALLLLFSDEGHERRACRAANDMQWFIENAGPTRSSVGPVSLRMSTGVHSGPCHFFLVGSTHRELVVAGPAATATMRLESAAGAGEVLVSHETAAALERTWLDAERTEGRLLKRFDPERDVEAAAKPPVHAAPDRLDEFIPEPLRSALVDGVEPEHRQVTAAFVKWSGSDSVLAQEGEAALLERLAALGSVAGDAAAEVGLTWLESDIDADGGKIYLTGGAPSSTGNDEEAMLRTLRTIVGTDVGLSLAAGANRGLAFAGDVGTLTRRTYAVTGDTVNLAARLTARAQAGEILATADVIDRALTRYETASRPLLVKGKERAVTAYAVGKPTLQRKEERSHDLPLVGREHEIAVLREALDGARRRQSHVVELVGAAGIGKSRLLEELKKHAVGFQLLSASCEPYGQSTPYGALRSLLRPLAGIIPEMSSAEAGELLEPWVAGVMPDLAPWLPLLAIPFDATVGPTPESEQIDPQFVHERLHTAVDQFLARVLMMPTLIVVEDGHWLDEASAFLLKYVAAQPTPRPWLIVVTRRPEGPTLVNGHGTVLELEPLPAAETVRLAVAAARDTALSEDALAAVRERSGGNPLFVCELVAAARGTSDVEALPQTVERLMTARIDTLAPADRALLRYAAVLGPSFEIDLLEEILAGEVEGIDDLDRWGRLAEFVRWEGPTRLAFVHDLFRKTAYEGLSFRRRREIHGRVGAAIEQRAGEAADDQAALLSLHFLQAEEYEKAWRYAVLAGHAAKRTFANVVAADLFERAFEAAKHLDELPSSDIGDVAEALGDVCELFASYERAASAYDLARQLFEDDSRAQLRLIAKIGMVCERQGRYAEALEWYDRGMGAVDDGDLERRAKLELGIAAVRHRQGNSDDAIRWAERAAAHAEQAGAHNSLAHAYFLLDLAHTTVGRPKDEYRKRALPIYRETGDLVGQANVLNNLGIGAYYEGRWDEALDFYRESGEVSRRAGDVITAASASNNAAEILSDQGKLMSAVEIFVDARRIWRAGRYPIGAQVATSNLGRAAARAGRFDEALRLLDEARRGFAEIGAAAFELEARAREAECLVLAGRYEEALEVCEEALPRAAGVAGTEVAHVELRRSLGYALVQSRRADEAGVHLEESARLARAMHLDYELALSLKALADTGVDLSVGAEAQTIFARLGVIEVPSPPLP